MTTLANPVTVSVVIPTYNSPDMLAETLESVFAQTFRDFEVVVINDGSTDDTLQRLEPFQAREPDRLRVITQANGGIGVARNRGIDEARGKYVALLDHDDLWMPTKLETQVAFLERNPQCIAAGVAYATSLEPSVPLFDRDQVCDERGIVQRPYYWMAREQYIMQTSMTLYDKQRAGDARFAVERGAIEDIPFQVLLLARGAYGIAGRDILGIYRVHGGNFSSTGKFYYAGTKQLRRLDAEGRFAEVSGGQRTDLDYWFGVIARASAFNQLALGYRGRAVELYVREFRHQAKAARLKFLLLFPLTALLPYRVHQRLLRRPRAGKV